MKKNLLIISLLFVFGYCHAEEADSRSNFEKAVDYLNCKMIENSFKSDPKKLADFTSKCNCDDLPTYDGIKSANDKSTTSARYILADETKKIKTRGLTITDTIKYLTEEIFMDGKSHALKKFDSLRRVNNSNIFVEFINEVKPNLQRILLCGAIKCDSEIPPPANMDTAMVKFIEGKITTLKDEINDKITTLSLIFWSIILVVICVGAYFIFKIIRKRKKTSSKDTLATLTKPLDSTASESKIPELEKTIEQLSFVNNNEIAKLKEAIEQLRKQQQQIIQAIQKLSTPPQIKIEPPSFDESPAPNVISVLYFSAPDTEDTFDNAAGSSQYKEGKSIYKFELTSTKDALFSIDTRENAVLMALKFPEDRIYRVCEQTDGINPHDAETIITIQKGVVHLIDNKWRLVNKAKIRLS